MTARRKKVGIGVYRNIRSGSYLITFQQDGRSVTRSGYQTLDEARKARARIIADQQKGLRTKASVPTLAAFIDTTWFPHWSASVRESTILNIRLYLRRIKDALGGTRIDRITPHMINGFLAETPYPYHAHKALSLILTFAARTEVINRNPMQAVPSVPRHPEPFTVYTAEQLSTYLAVAPPILRWIALTGCRQGEARGMQWADLRGDTWFVAGTIIQADVNRRGTTKTAAGRRPIPITATLSAILPEQRPDDPWVWSSRCAVNRKHRIATLAAGLPYIRVHDLRHTWATLALTAGVHPKLVQQQLGHASISMTLDVYSAVLPELTRHAAESVENLLSLDNPLDTPDELCDTGHGTPPEPPESA